MPWMFSKEVNEDNATYKFFDTIQFKEVNQLFGYLVRDREQNRHQKSKKNLFIKSQKLSDDFKSFKASKKSEELD